MNNKGQFKKGQSSWNKELKGYRKGHPGYYVAKGEDNHFFGKKHTPETKEKMRLAKLGKEGFNKGKTWKVSPEKLVNLGKQKGEKHWNWKGGITPKNSLDRLKFRQEVFKEVLKRDNFTCQTCTQIGGHLQVHHIQNWANYPEKRFDINNCKTICMACHYKLTFGRELPRGIVWGHNLSNIDKKNV